MKRRTINAVILAIFAILYIILFGALKANAFYFSLGPTYENRIIDINKPGPGFEDTCTHAAMSNAMAFAVGEDVVFAYHLYHAAVDKLGNIPTSPDVVFNEIMDQAKAVVGYFRYANIHQAFYNNGRDWGDLIKSQLFGGFVIIILLDIPGQNLDHVVTVYGFSEDDYGNSSLLYVDSDDGVSESFMGLLLTDNDNVTTFQIGIPGDLTTTTVKGYVAIRVVGK
jgi:hypothetical protein